MKVLILGGNSYIAKNFIETYATRYHLKIIKRDKNFQDYFQLQQKDFKDIEVVINFTAIVHQKKAIEELYEKYNYSLVRYLVNLTQEAGVKHFVQMSTVAVYGELTFIDANSTPSPVTYYGKYKLKADEYLQEEMSSKMIISILRPPVVYGKDAPGNMQKLIKLIQSYFPLPLRYDKNQRAILCVHNLCNAIDIIVNKRVKGCFLLKDKNMPSIYELSKEIKSLSGSKSILFHPILKLIIASKLSILKKIYGNLIIDDTKTIKKIGKYKIDTWQDCIKKMI